MSFRSFLPSIHHSPYPFSPEIEEPRSGKTSVNRIFQKGRKMGKRERLKGNETERDYINTALFVFFGE